MEKDKPDELLYETFSVCPLCALLEKRGLMWKDAWVLQRDQKIFLKIKYVSLFVITSFVDQASALGPCIVSLFGCLFVLFCFDFRT